MAEAASPPQNVEAEAMLLAAVMDDDANTAEASSMVAVDDFYREGHRRVWVAILDLFHRGEPIEPLTVTEQLVKQGDLDAVGGRMGVLDLMDRQYLAANYRAYAEIVRDTATQRRLLQVGQRIQTIVMEREGETAAMVQDAETLIYEMSQKRVRGDFTQARDLILRGVERLTTASDRGSEVVGLPTGYADLDHVLGGLMPGNLVVVAARPSMGKTALALGMASHVALNEGGTVAMFSLEMSGDELIQRLISSAATVDAGRMRSGRLSAEDWPRVSHAADRLSSAKLFIDDSEGVSVGEMRTKARRLKSREGLDLVIVDYIQLMESPRTRRDDNRQQEMAQISRALKMLARDLEVPIICVSQLNRAAEARTDKRPMLSDLRESGAIEQDADLVLMIYRDEYYNDDSEEKGIAEVHVAKNRHGPVDRVKLTFMGNYAKFGTLAKDAVR